jgi:anti-sigma B factor antagonist
VWPSKKSLISSEIRVWTFVHLVTSPEQKPPTMNSDLTRSNSRLPISRQILASIQEMPVHLPKKQEDTAARLVIAERVYNNTRIVELTGPIHLETSPLLHKFLQKKLNEQPAKLLLDLAGVPSVDSTGLAVLIDYRREACHFNGRLALSGLGPRILAAMSIVRLEPIFSIYENITDGLAALAVADEVSSSSSLRRQVPRPGRNTYNPFALAQSLACSH